jgi:pyrroline-5-carboxylate reductase
MIQQRLGFLGAGRMATALAQGFLRAGLTTADCLAASDPVEAAAERFSAATGAHCAASNAEVIAGCEVVFLAVKPQNVVDVLDEVRGKLTKRHLLVSIAAGVRTATLARLSGAAEGTGPRIIRVMPNTPCLVGQSATGYCLGPGATQADAQLVGQLLSAVGRAYQLDEDLLDAVTGLSGSGPAFVYTIIEALSDGGVQMGLPREVATALAAQTVKGAAEMVLVTGQHPGALKDQVASPGGTTIAGLAALEAGGLRWALMRAVEAATLRSLELGNRAAS